MPIRKVKSTGRNVTGSFPSGKMGRMIHFESLVERDCLYALDYFPIVKTIEEQPLTIEYKVGNKRKSYTPDFLVTLHDHRKFLFECKPEAFVDTEKNRLLYNVGVAYCEPPRHWHYKVVTDTKLRDCNFVANLKELRRFAKYEIDRHIQIKMLDLLARSTQPLTVGEAIVYLNPENPERMVIPILNMAYHQKLYLSLRPDPISLDSIIYKEATNEQATFFNSGGIYLEW